MSPWLGILLLAPVSLAAETHRLKPDAGHPTFAVRPPVLTLKPGDVLETETLWGEWYEKPGGKWPGEVGPIGVEGAEAGDTLVVEILKIRPNRETAVSLRGGNTGACVDVGGALPSDPLPRDLWRIDRASMTGTLDLPGFAIKAVAVPLRTMLGRVAVAPEGEPAFGRPGPFGGNLDVSEVREGTTLYLPVFHKGALFYFGDGRAQPADGGLSGSNLATSMEVAFRFGLRKKKTIGGPRLENAEHLMVTGSACPLSEAVRLGFRDLAGWLATDHGFARADATRLVSQVAVVRVASLGGPLSTVVAKFPRRFLPPGVGRSAGAGVRLGDLPWPEAEKRLTADRVVVLPLGAGSKEHGPHLLLRNDAILADYFAQRVMEARPVVLLPTLTYGFYPAFLEYPGSTSLSFETQRDAVAEICRSIARHGPRRFYVLNTGVSTARPLQATAEGLAGEGILMRFTDLDTAGQSAVNAVRQEKYGTHADEIETSMILYMEPGAVRMEKAVADGAGERPGPLTRDRENALGHYAPSGVFGDATLATWQKGETVVEGMLGDILREIDALAAAPAPAGTPRSALDREGPR